MPNTMVRIGDAVKVNMYTEAPDWFVVRSIEVDCVDKHGTHVQAVEWNTLLEMSANVQLGLQRRTPTKPHLDSRWCHGYQVTAHEPA